MYIHQHFQGQATVIVFSLEM